MSRVFRGPLGSQQEWPSLDGVSPLSVTYDDVLLVPQANTEIKSRSEVDTSIEFGPYKLKIPIISSPMDTIGSESMIRKLAELGAIGSLPRGDTEENLKICEKLSSENIPCVYTIGIKDAFDMALKLKNKGAKFIMIDVAHGGQKQVVQAASEIINKLEIDLIVGNIATYTQAKWYKNNGIKYAKVGVGPGSVCMTRIVTGTGIPQLSAVFDTSSCGIKVIADGGIKYSGDVAKAIAAGANMVMIGSLLAGTDETPGIVQDGKKLYRGQASVSFMTDNHISTNGQRSAEGISTFIDCKGPVKEVIDSIYGGLRSAMSYSGASNINQFQSKSQFVIVSHATQKENIPHIII